MSTKETRIDSLTENRHIADFLDEYFTSFDDNNPPGYAVLLSGEWGCGKTFLMKEIMQIYDLNSKKKSKKEKEIEKKDKESSPLSVNLAMWQVVYQVFYKLHLFIGSIINILYQLLYGLVHLVYFLLLYIIKCALWLPLQERKNDEGEKDLFIYISLYGIKYAREIDAAIVRQLYPKVSAIEGIVGDIFARNNSSHYIGSSVIGFIGDALTAKIRVFRQLSNKEKNKIFIFDDLERCCLDGRELLGYINNLVEHKRKRVVLLSNQEKLFDGEEQIREYKEKVIGRTFKVTPCFEGAFDLFIGSVKDKDAKMILDDYKKTIQGVYKSIGSNNLRSVKQSILGFSHFIHQFKDDMLDALRKRETLNYWTGAYTDFSRLDYVVHIYFYLSMEEKRGKLHEKNWIEHVNALYSDIETTRGSKAKQSKIKKSDVIEEKECTTLKESLANDRILGQDWYEGVINGKDVTEVLDLAYLKMEFAAEV